MPLVFSSLSPPPPPLPLTRPNSSSLLELNMTLMQAKTFTCQKKTPALRAKLYLTDQTFTEVWDNFRQCTRVG